MINITTYHQNIFINNLSNKKEFSILINKLISDSYIRLFINVNLFNDIVWFNKENFELLLNFIFVHNFVELINTDQKISQKNKKDIITILKTIQKWKFNAKESNYQLDKIFKNSIN